MPIIEAKVGAQTLTDGSPLTVRAGRSGELNVGDAHGRYQEAAIRGNLFLASNVAAQALSVALATAYTGLMLSNPIGNTKNLVLLGAQLALSAAPAAIASLHLIGGYSAVTQVTHTTPLAAPGIQNALLGTGQASSMKADSSATIPTPGYILPLGSGFTAAALYATTPLWIDLGGCIVLPPGGFIGWGALTAVTGFGGFLWEEVPV